MTTSSDPIRRPGDIREIVIHAISGSSNLPEEAITEDLNLFELGLDSLDISSVLIDVEDAMGTEIPAEILNTVNAVEDITTVGDVVNLLSGWVKLKDSSSRE